MVLKCDFTVLKCDSFYAGTFLSCHNTFQKRCISFIYRRNTCQQ